MKTYEVSLPVIPIRDEMIKLQANGASRGTISNPVELKLGGNGETQKKEKMLMLRLDVASGQSPLVLSINEQAKSRSDCVCIRTGIYMKYSKLDCNLGMID